MEVIVTIASKLGYFTYLGHEINLLLILGLGHPVTKYHGHTSTMDFSQLYPFTTMVK